MNLYQCVSINFIKSKVFCFALCFFCFSLILFSGCSVFPPTTTPEEALKKSAKEVNKILFEEQTRFYNIKRKSIVGAIHELPLHNTFPITTNQSATYISNQSDKKTKRQKDKLDKQNKKIKIKLWHWLAGEQFAAVKKFVDEYNQQNPKIEVVPEFVGDQDFMQQKLIISAFSKSLPDIAIITHTWLPELVSTNRLIPIGNFLTSDEKKDFFQQILDIHTIGGKVYSAPVDGNNEVIFYNKTLFKSAGLNPERPPKTWKELISFAKKLTKDLDGDGNIDQWGVANLSFRDVLWTNGGDFLALNENEFEQIKPQKNTFLSHTAIQYEHRKKINSIFDSKEGIEALNFLLALKKTYKITPTTIPTNGFERGAIAIYKEGVRKILNYQKAGLKFGVGFIPKNKNFASRTGNDGLVIFNTMNEKKQKAAWDFIKWFTSPKIYLRWCLASFSVPIKKSILDMTEYKKFLQKNKFMQVFIEQILYAKSEPKVIGWKKASKSIDYWVSCTLK